MAKYNPYLVVFVVNLSFFISGNLLTWQTSESKPTAPTVPSKFL